MQSLRAIQLSKAAKTIRPLPFLITDRVVYHNNDPVLQIVGGFAGETRLVHWSLVLNQIDPARPDVQILSDRSSGSLPSEFEFLLEKSLLGVLGPAKFALSIIDENGAMVMRSNEFECVTDARHAGMKLPTTGIPIIVEAAPADRQWPITTGIPLPLGAVSDPTALGLFDAAGGRIPAQINAIAEWYPPVGVHRSVKWLSVDFVAECHRTRPTQYFLRAATSSPPSPDLIVDDDAGISVNTGPIRFTMKKHGFNGIDKLERWTGTAWRVVSQYGLGPYLEVRAKGDTERTAAKRIRFTAAADPTATVKIIKQGDVCVVIRAEGDYYYGGPATEWENPGGPIGSDTQRRHCHFVIDITAYRGTAQINIASTIILTYDPGNVREDLTTAIPDSYFSSQSERADRLGKPYIPRLGEWWKQPIDIGWDWGVSATFERGWFGYDTGNGSSVWPAEPWVGDSRVSLHQFAADQCSFVVESFDGLRRDVRRVAGGKRSEGWATADLGNDAFTVALRDVWQRFPKELSFSRSGSDAHLTVHTWPRHGLGPDDRFSGSETLSHRSGNLTVVPGETEDSLLRTKLWKLPFAHEGDALDLRAPTTLIGRWIELHRAPQGTPDAGWDQDQSIQNAVSRTAQGLATTSEIALFVHNGSSTPGGSAAVHTEARNVARFWQSQVHALAQPQWNGDSRAEGRFDAPSAAHSAIEAGSTRAIDSWRLGLGGVEGCYGMWIYGSLHDNWMTEVRVSLAGVDQRVGMPKLHRIWQASHYRNVWMAWLLYLRSGDYRAREWALATSRLYADVGTVHKGPYSGRHAGDMAHCYSITPWGTQYDPIGHWIDPDAHRLRYCLVGDLYAQRLYDLWWQSLSQQKPPSGLSRECTNTLGAIADYFAFTHEPSAMALMRTVAAATLADQRRVGATNYPFYNLTNFNHPVWNRRWLEQYYDLTGDIDAVRLAVDLVEQGDAPPQTGAFAFLEMQRYGAQSPRGIAIKSYLERHLGNLWDTAVRVLDSANGPYHGHGDHISAAASYWLQEWPYFAHALRQASIATPAAPRRNFIPPGKVATSPTAPNNERIAYPTRASQSISPADLADPQTAWLAAALTVYVLADANFTINLLMQGGTNIDNVNGYLRVYRYQSTPAPASWVTVIPQTEPGLAVSFDAKTPLIIPVPHTGPQALYQINLISHNLALVKAPLTSLPEVLELRGPALDTHTPPTRIGTWIQQASVATFGRQLWYVAAADGTPQPLTIVMEAGTGFSDKFPGWPSAVLVQDAAGRTIKPRRVIPPLPPIGPYEYNGRIGPAATAGEPVRTAGGLYQIARFLDNDQKAQLAFVVDAHANAPARLFCAAAYGPILRLEGNSARAYLALDRLSLVQIVNYVNQPKVRLSNP